MRVPCKLCSRDRKLQLVGIALWTAAGLAAFALARLLPPARPRGWILELLIALAAALLFGLAATALDFGGWQELEWRAGVFAFFGALVLVGLFRLASTIRS